MDVGHAFFCKAGGKDRRGTFRVAVHGGINEEHSFFFWFIRGPMDILIKEPRNVLSPDRSMERANHLDLEGGSFFRRSMT